MKVVRLKPYVRAMKGMGLGEQARVEIELVITRAPEAHPMIRGLRGVRRAFRCPDAERVAAAE